MWLKCLITKGWLQVVASQKQLEMKYKQAQQTAVRGLDTRPLVDAPQHWQLPPQLLRQPVQRAHH